MHWDTEKNAIRRTIGIYHWDKLKLEEQPEISRKALIQNTIKLLEDKNPKLLSHFHSGFNKPDPSNPEKTLGNTNASIYKSVIREMEADCELTALCILKAEHLSPNDAKTTNKKL